MKKPVMLTILDGFGWRDDRADNAVALANTPVFDRLWGTGPRAMLRTCGADVGLPDGQMGNSEVGHTNIGAGRVVMQDLPRIDAAIMDGVLASNPELQRFVATLRQTGGACHLLGLVSPGGVHAHLRHVGALATIMADAGIRVFIHAITDGRDTAPESGADCLEALGKLVPPGVEIATVIGRYFAMDRDKRWDRVKRAYDLVVAGVGTRSARVVDAVRESYRAAVTDEFIAPIVVPGYAGMADGDGLLCANFRADRVREVLEALLDPRFAGFDRARVPVFSAALGMVAYSDDLDAFMRCLFPPVPMTNLLGEVVARAGRRQLRAAETEKYPHVTYFLNGGREAPFAGETRIMVASPKVATYDLQPEMSAVALTDQVVAALETGDLDLIVLNFANPDMVGHTGVLSAAITAVETVDFCLGRIVAAIEALGGTLLVTADHGNCEQMRDPVTGGPHTAHTLNRVPLVMVGGTPEIGLADGRLADIAPTLLALLDIAQPVEMTGVSLIDGRRDGA